MDLRYKIIKLSTLKKKISAARKQGKEIAFTNGCFDIIHYGHIKYLYAAKKKNRLLIVGLNSDKSVSSIKGHLRPIIKERERAFILAALSCVDYVILFDEDTPESLIQSLKPDVLIKGADWRGKRIAGADFVLSRGGKIEYIDYLKGKSSTNIISTIIERYNCLGDKII